ncbi:AMP-binding protein [Lipingzhangella sp. LS1_29]|uniref:AMP-binding protein n=1 Tax=Lipingzhangella rawalii TaxID=2055835 RepID=A0ABU2HAX2_9ACTN|nr:AMP-binding protein [Lipingzhangella rawalii]MDS1272468.1 AMP-binding protein [Lipingzhangella rawalii]
MRSDRTPLGERILDQARDRPAAPALVWHGQETSYGHLHHRTQAQRTRLERVEPEFDRPLGIWAAKSPEAVALVLACLCDERPFLLLPTDLPSDTATDLARKAGCRFILPATGDPEQVHTPEEWTRQRIPDGTTFMLTTSGSTGRPKIVPLGGAAVGRFMDWAGPAFDLGPGTTVLNHAPLSFDLCLFDIWTSLAHGARVVLVDPEYAAQGRHLLKLIVTHEVTVMQAVPMAYGLLLDAARAADTPLAGVRHAIVTGDVLPERTHAGLTWLLPRARAHNVYGCTETNDSFRHEITGTETHRDGGLPIGSPIPGVRALVLDDNGEEVTHAGTGELYVCTPFQSEGYLDRGLRSDAFLSHPLGRDERQWYRTGDLVRREADGSIRLLGRVDFQVKIRGVAVNLAEVERTLLSHPDVLEAGVTTVPDPVAGRALLSVIRRTQESELTSLSLRRHCVQRLPRAFVPTNFRVLDEALPRTSTGKVDRTALDRL